VGAAIAIAEAPSKAARAGPLIAVMALGGTAYGFAATMVIPAVPALQRGLDVSPAAAGWVLSAYLVAASVLTGIVGRLGDVFGRRRTLVASLGVFAIGAAICAAAGSMPLLLLGRVVQGAGGGIYPLAYGILAERLEPAKRASALGLMAATMGIGAGIGPVLGGVISDHASHRWIFVVVGLLALAAAAAVLRVVPRAGRPVGGRAAIDLPGALVLAVTVSAPLIAISQANRWGWSDPLTLGLLGLGVVMLGVFIAVERRVPQPLVSMRTMALPVVRWTNVVAISYSIWAFGTLIAITLVAQQESGSGFGLSATQAGLILIPNAVGVLVGGALTARLGARRGFRLPLLLGQVVGIAALVPFVFLHDVLAVAYVVSGVVGLGTGLSLAANTNLIVSAVSAGETATATGISTVVRNVGGAIGVQVPIALFATDAIVGGNDFGDSGLTLGFAFLAGAALVALALVRMIPAASAPHR
jgi:MFS family permease